MRRLGTTLAIGQQKTPDAFGLNLRGRTMANIRLEPIQDSHLSSIREQFADESNWRWMFRWATAFNSGGIDGLLRKLESHLRETKGRAFAVRCDELPNEILAIIYDYPPVEESWSVETGTAIQTKFRGRGYFRKVKVSHLDNIFETFPDVNRIHSLCDKDNLIVQKALATFGATREGLLRKFRYRDQLPVDVVVFSILRDEWPEIRRGVDE